MSEPGMRLSSVSLIQINAPGWRTGGDVHKILREGASMAILAAAFLDDGREDARIFRNKLGNCSCRIVRQCRVPSNNLLGSKHPQAVKKFAVTT